MRVIDIDVELLRKSADTAHPAAEETRIHIEAEIFARVRELRETFTGEGPTILLEVRSSRCSD